MKLTKKQLVRAIKDTAKALDIEPTQVKTGELQEHAGISEWQVRQFGGLAAIKKAAFPLQEKDLKSIVEDKATSAYISKLEKQLGNQQIFQDEVKAIMDEKLKPLPKIKLKNKKKQKTKIKREIVMMLNDTHYGLIVDPDEIGGLNKYDWQEACRRTAMVLQETIDFKPHTREEVETVHLVLNGDLISGCIHGLNTKGIDLYIHQLNGALHILTHTVSHLLENFKNVMITGISGNHGDALHKREHGNRVLGEKFDSYENTVFFGLSTAFRNNDRVKFNFPKTPYAFVNLPGGRAMICHGDVMFSSALGNPGTSINVKSLGNEIRKFNAGEMIQGRDPVKLVLFGHTHSFAHFMTSDGVEIYNAPSLSGTDGFAHSLTINTNLIGQVVFESTKDFILGDARLVRVKNADMNSSLDSLIPTFKRDLAWKK